MFRKSRYSGLGSSPQPTSHGVTIFKMVTGREAFRPAVNMLLGMPASIAVPGFQSLLYS